MGYLIKMECPSCGKEGTFPLGYGRNDFNGNKPKLLGFCENCKKFQAMRPGDLCECGGKLVAVYDDAMRQKGIKKISCPVCEAEIELSQVGFWD